MVSCLVSINLTETCIWEEGLLIEKMLPKDLPAAKSVRYCSVQWLVGKGLSHCGCCPLGAGSPRWYKKANHEEQTGKQHPSVALASALASGFLT